MPQHTHRWEAEAGGRTVAEKEMERSFLTGHSSGVGGSNYVEPCTTFPYCNYIPPPVPVVPPPYQLSAPPPQAVFPVMGMPPRMPWHPPAKGLGLNSGPLLRSNPENQSMRQHSISKEGEEILKQDLMEGSFAGSGSGATKAVA